MTLEELALIWTAVMLTLAAIIQILEWRNNR